MLVKLVTNKRDEWDEYIDSCVYAYNTVEHESTKYTPFELMFGRKAILAIDIDIDNRDCNDLAAEFDEVEDDDAIQAITENRIIILQQAKANIERAQKKQKLLYDRKHGTAKGFIVGDKVLKKDFLKKKRAGGKLDTRFVGRYIVTSVIGKGL